MRIHDKKLISPFRPKESSLRLGPSWDMRSLALDETWAAIPLIEALRTDSGQSMDTPGSIALHSSFANPFESHDPVPLLLFSSCWKMKMKLLARTTTRDVVARHSEKDDYGCTRIQGGVTIFFVPNGRLRVLYPLRSPFGLTKAEEEEDVDATKNMFTTNQESARDFICAVSITIIIVVNIIITLTKKWIKFHMKRDLPLGSKIESTHLFSCYDSYDIHTQLTLFLFLLVLIGIVLLMYIYIYIY